MGCLTQPIRSWSEFVLVRKIFLEKFMKKQIVSIFCMMIITCITSTVSFAATTEDTAIEAAVVWLSLVDSGEYSKSWTQSAEIFKSAITKTKWEETLDTVQKPLGNLLSRNMVLAKSTTTLPGAPDGEYVVIQFKSNFANKKTVLETVTPTKDSDGKWRVSGYFIK
jgi:hypothetical protein